MTSDCPPLRLVDFLKPQSTRNVNHCHSKKRALEMIAEIASAQLDFPPQRLFEALLNRERLGSTAIGGGVALPHGKLKDESFAMQAVFIHLDEPIDFGASDSQPVDLLFALFIPLSHCRTHADILAQVGARFADKTLCRSLRAAQSDETLYELIISTDSSIIPE